jgi:hypothetical protein
MGQIFDELVIHLSCTNLDIMMKIKIYMYINIPVLLSIKGTRLSNTAQCVSVALGGLQTIYKVVVASRFKPVSKSA